MKKQVLNFINHFTHQNQYEQVIEIFTCGLCYWFAKILEERFNGILAYDEIANHFGCLIDNNIYDITGDVTNNYEWKIWYNTDSYKDKLVRDRIKRDCILKED